MKRLLTLTLALVMSLSLTACGGSDDDGRISDEKLAELTEAYNNVAVPYNEIANLVNENGWMADEQTNAEMNALNSTLGTVGTALTEDISMLDGADVDALIASLSDELPGALAELKDRVSVPYEG